MSVSAQVSCQTFSDAFGPSLADSVDLAAEGFSS